MLIGHKRFGYFYCGRDIYRIAGYVLQLCLWPRKDPPQGEIAWHFNFEIHFCPPRRVYELIEPKFDELDSSTWNGRQIVAQTDWSRMKLKPRLQWIRG